MKKMRLESLEHLCHSQPPAEVAKLGFLLIDQNIAELEEIGIKIEEVPDIVILNGSEYHRENKRKDAKNRI